MNQDLLLSYVLGIVLGLLAYVFYSSSLKSGGKTIITFKDGYSMKYHNFVWFFLLPIWAVSGLVDYAINFEDLNFFPCLHFQYLFYGCLSIKENISFRRCSIDDGASDGNRTRVTTLGRSGSTIEPRSHTSIIL